MRLSPSCCALAVVFALAHTACASSTGGGVVADGGPTDAGASDAAAPPDAGRPGVATGVRGGFCAGGGRSEGTYGADEITQTVVHTTCVAPVDVAAHARRQGTVQWQPGPIYFVAPP